MNSDSIPPPWWLLAAVSFAMFLVASFLVLNAYAAFRGRRILRAEGQTAAQFYEIGRSDLHLRDPVLRFVRAAFRVFYALWLIALIGACTFGVLRVMRGH